MDRIRNRRIGTVAAALGAAVAVVAVFAPPGHASGARWDPDVAPVAHAVEAARGLVFERPVPVVTLGDDEYRTRVGADVSDLTSRQRDALEATRAQLSAVSLVDADTDLTRAVTALPGIESAAFYDPITKQVYVRGSQPPLAVRPLLHTPPRLAAPGVGLPRRSQRARGLPGGSRGQRRRCRMCRGTRRRRRRAVTGPR